MPTTKSHDPSTTNSHPLSSKYTSTEHPHSKPTRRGWFFHRGGSNNTSRKGSATATTDSRTNHARSAPGHGTIGTSDNHSTAMSSIGGGTASTTTHNQNTTSVTFPGILKKETKDYDAIISSKRYEEQMKNTSWFCRTKYFQKMCHQAYDVIDSDQSGDVDEKELYAGLLLIHLQLGMYAGPAACRPLSREQVHTVFIKMDTDQSGTLNKLEFQAIMAVLFSNVILRVMVQWCMTIMIVPWLAQFILSSMTSLITFITNIITNLDEHSAFFNFIELTLEGTTLFLYTLLPKFVKVMISITQRGIYMVPTSVWKALPLTILSTILGIVVVPYCIFQIDHYFQTLADRHQKRQLEKNQRQQPTDNNMTNTDADMLIYKSKSL